MQPGFHARKSAISRRYRYVIGTDDGERLAVPPTVRMGAGARRSTWRRFGRPPCWSTGEHDFRAFAAKGEPKPHYRCRLRRSEWEARAGGRGVSFHVEADRFLHHMVRMLVGTMVDVGLGRRPLATSRRLLERGDNQETSPPAPPQGLYFVAADVSRRVVRRGRAEERHARDARDR